LAISLLPDADQPFRRERTGTFTHSQTAHQYNPAL
jgi:hypothetical protein